MFVLIIVLLLSASALFVESFRYPSFQTIQYNQRRSLSSKLRETIADKVNNNNSNNNNDDSKRPAEFLNKQECMAEIRKLKMDLLRLCATFDRGFAATKEDAANIADIISSLKLLAFDKNPTRGLTPNQTGKDGSGDAPIEGIWKLAYTTAFDVVSLNGSPLYQLQGIYQVIRSDGSSANVIDLVPRFQTLLPSSISSRISSSTRAVVGTSSYARSSTRVGLSFRSVRLKPLSVLGLEFKDLPFSVPSLKIDLPRFGLNDDDNANRSGYFDIEYLDNDCLIISQNQPGGIFVNFRDYTLSFDEIFN